MTSIKPMFFLIALVLFLIAAWPPATARVNLVALGLGFWVATWLVP